MCLILMILDVIETLLGKGYSIRIFDRNVRFSKLMGANKEYILKKIPYVSKFLVKKSETIIDHSDVIVVVNKEKEFEKILNRASEDRIIYDLVDIDFEDRHRMKNYVGIAW